MSGHLRIMQSGYGSGIHYCPQEMQHRWVERAVTENVPTIIPAPPNVLLGVIPLDAPIS